MAKSSRKIKNVTMKDMGVPSNNDHLESNLLTENEVVNTLPSWFDPSSILKGRTKKQKQFLKKAIKINSTDEYFTFRDFPELGHDAFRKTVGRLKDVITCAYRSSAGAHYRVKGVPITGDQRKIQLNPKLGTDFYYHIAALKTAPVGLHDIRLKFPSSLIHKVLKAEGFESHPSNSLIQRSMHLDKDLVATIQVYPNTVVVIISCTYRPIGCDLGGMISLNGYMGQVYQALFHICGGKSDFSHQNEWIVIHYHLGKDARRSYTGHFTGEIKFDEFSGGMIRFYLKKWKDGEIRLRAEQVCTPGFTLKEMAENGFDLQTDDLDEAILSLQVEEENKMVLEQHDMDLELDAERRLSE